MLTNRLSQKTSLFFFITFFSLTFTTNGQIQDSTLHKDELYLKVNSLLTGDFGFQYKHRVGQNHFLRFSSLTSSTNSVTNDPGVPSSFKTKTTYFNSGLNIGLEKRKQYNSKLTFFYGVDFIGQFDSQTQRTDNPSISQRQQKVYDFGLSFGLGLGLGFLYNIKDNIHLGFALTPNVLVKYSEDENYNNNPAVKVKRLVSRQELNTNNLSLSIVYFMRKD
jgi:hypothetical protein